jgi:polyferredoxin
MTTSAQGQRVLRRNTHRNLNRTNTIRRISQLFFAGLVLVASVRHGLGEQLSSGITASTDALCPFGAVETLWTWITTGRFVSKTHPSNLVLGLGLLIGALLAGSSFCGWICPFGAFQDALTWIKRKLHLPQIKLSGRTDKILRYGRFVVLGVILYATITSTKLWFAEYDPYRTLFSLHWLFELDFAEMWPGFAILGVVTAGALLIERAWCRYLCPLGGVLSVLGHFSLLRIRRSEANCTGCALCERSCPVGIPVAEVKFAVDTDCVGCLVCVETCPQPGALEVQFAPSWWEGIKRVLRRPTAA